MDANCLCVDCGKYYKNPNTLRMHQKIHTGLRPFTCDVCNKSFWRKDVLGEHFKAHKNQSNYVCQQCGKSFCRRFSLQAHAMSHTPDKKYACKNCPKTYLIKSNLTKHEETHREKETCPKCNICVKHSKEHTKTCGATSSFQCSTCEKTFEQKRYLAQHMLTHLPSKQYECQNVIKALNTEDLCAIIRTGVHRSNILDSYFVSMALRLCTFLA